MLCRDMGMDQLVGRGILRVLLKSLKQESKLTPKESTPLLSQKKDHKELISQTCTLSSCFTQMLKNEFIMRFQLCKTLLSKNYAFFFFFLTGLIIHTHAHSNALIADSLEQ